MELAGWSTTSRAARRSRNSVQRRTPEVLMFGFRKTLSEEEYVEEIRRRVSAVQRVRPFFLAMFSLMVCLIIFVLYTTPKMISNMPYERVMVYGGISLGVFIGFLLTTFVAL
ncbi:MAG: hypothetical protein U1F77_01620 [Kiritimatiellia bacterium]